MQGHILGEVVLISPPEEQDSRIRMAIPPAMSLRRYRSQMIPRRISDVEAR